MNNVAAGHVARDRKRISAMGVRLKEISCRVKVGQPDKLWSPKMYEF